MKVRKGFTLVEIIVVIIIVGILVAIALPNFFNSIEQTKAQSAQNNLLAIAAAESKYFEDHGKYYSTPTPRDDTNGLNSNLSLGMGSGTFNYYCLASSASSGPVFTCTATDVPNNGPDTLTLTPGVNTTVKCVGANTQNTCPSNLQ